MANRASLLKQSDLTRYAKAMRAAGVPEWCIKVEPNGTHTIIAGKLPDTMAGPDPDKLLK
ncbi:MAG: hypothetical protein ACK4GO_09455 [Gemmobacter sp.]